MEVVELADWTDEIGIVGNIFIRKVKLTGHQMLPGHQHNFDHATFVGQGRVRVTITYPDGRMTVTEYTAPTFFEVPADATHQVEALSDGAICYCAFAVRDPSGEIAEHVTESHREDRFYHERRNGGDRA